MEEDEVAKTRMNSASTRQKWTEEEESEIRDLFGDFFESKIKPKPYHVGQCIEQSKKNNGLIYKRSKDVLKKKVFRMIEKLSDSLNQ